MRTNHHTAPGGGRIGSDEPKSRQESEAPVEDGEEGEAMDDTNPDDEAMTAMMGLTGFGSTKVCYARYQCLHCLSYCNQFRANVSKATRKVPWISRRYGHGAST